MQPLDKYKYVKFKNLFAEICFMQETNSIEAEEVREYRAGEVVVKEGDPGEFFYAIMQGEVTVKQRDKTVRIIGDRDIFGLENYYRQMTYSTTARAAKPSRIARYRSELIDEMIHSKPGLVSLIIKSAYLQLEQTTSIAEANIQYSESISLDIREYNDGDVIIEEDTHGDEIYKLYSTEGGLEVLKNNQRIAVINQPGEYFGEMSFLLNEARTATIRSIGKSMVEVIPVVDGDVESIIYNDPEMGYKMVRTLAQRLKQTNLKLVGNR